MTPASVDTRATVGSMESTADCRYTNNIGHYPGLGNAMNAETKTKIVVLTGNHRITGSIDLLPGARVTDFLLECRNFMAITNAEVWDLNGRKLFSSSFMNVNRDRIELIMPEDTVTQGLGHSVA